MAGAAAPTVLDPEFQRRVRDRAWQLAESGGAEGWLHNVLLLQHNPAATSTTPTAYRRGGHNGDDEEAEDDGEDDGRALAAKTKENERRVERARRELAKRQAVLRPLRLGMNGSGDSESIASSRHQRAGVVKAKIAHLEAALRVLDLEEERDEAGEALGDLDMHAVRPDVATAELDQAMTLLRRQLHHATQALARERELTAETRAIGEALTRQLQQSMPPEAASQEEREEMMAKTEQLRECNVELREGLLEFADRIRPPPSSTNQEPATKRARGVVGDDQPQYASLREALVALLDAAHPQSKPKRNSRTKPTKEDNNSSAGEGWMRAMTAEGRLWAPVDVTLLLRAGVVQQHPKDPSLLRLRSYTAQ